MHHERNRLRWIIVMGILVLAVVLAGCESAGAGGDDDSTGDSTEVPPDDGGGSGDGGTGGDTDQGDSGTSESSEIPASAAGIVDGSALGALYVSGGGGPFAEVIISTSESGLSDPAGNVAFDLTDATDSVDLDSGTYQYDSDGGAPMTFDYVQILSEDVELGSEGFSGSYIASDSNIGGGGLQAFDLIVGGTLEISGSGDTQYTISWSLETSDGESVSGSYTGPVDILDDLDA